MNPKTAQAIADLRHGAIPALDEQTMAMVKADVKKLYGWDWPAGMDLVNGTKALFEYLMRKANHMSIGQEIEEELARAMAKHAPMHSAHEGYAVILEELDELWDEIKLQTQDPVKMRKEAIQVAAMAARFVRDVVDKKCAVCGSRPVANNKIGMCAICFGEANER